MSARIKHVAIVSHNIDQLQRFYSTLFGMSGSGDRMPGTGAGAAVVTDGYVGMNINGRANGRQGGFDHFGFEVDDVEQIEARVREAYPTVHLLRRPSSRPFAGISMHDPAGNVFDLSHKAMENRRDIYVADEREAPRHIDHFMLRTVDAPTVARFYRDVFELEEREKSADDPNTYLTDGKVTLIVAPWRIADYAGSGIERPALDHLGFKVESLDAFKADLDRMIENDPSLTPRAFRPGEGDVRLALLKTCQYGELHFADPDGVLLEVSED
jgi:catechol 2,3-dioxygenase-like lactoylglutathione lyase family enzyme